MQDATTVDLVRAPWKILWRLARRHLPAGALTLAGLGLVVARWPALMAIDYSAFGLVAVGLNAVGIVGVGINAVGLVTIGGANSVGLIAIGGANSAGLVAIGGYNAAGVLAIGGHNSVGLIAVGRRALGYFALARITGRGSYVLSPDRQDWGARWYFERLCPGLFVSGPRVR